MNNILGSGAEATIVKTSSGIRKIREPKAYRHPLLDHQLRLFRTRREVKVLQKAAIPCPKVLHVDEKTCSIDMEYVAGPQLRDVLTEANARRFGVQLGTLIRSLHDSGIIHGDLTTSNVIVRNEELVLIDFGLSFFSQKVEDIAVDLHLLKQSVHAKHPNLPLWESIWSSYDPSMTLQERFKSVEGRGRYKQKGS